MEFKFYMSTEVFFGKDCIEKNKSILNKFGSRAFIVTGRNSGRVSGALQDVEKVLKDLNMEYQIFDSIENNPSLESVGKAAEQAKVFKAEFIIAVGGGSPLDAAKAVAVLTVNPIEPVQLFTNNFDKKPLAVIAIPTTAGTGSEVTPYSILTRRDMQTKMSFGTRDTFPEVAFLDARYTEKLPGHVAVNTAVDAFSHAMEGYLSKRSTIMSDVLAAEAISIFGECMEDLLTNHLDTAVREKLLYMSMLGGMVIAQTGTTIIHGMGYSLTYFKDIPHGRANGLLMRECLKFNYSVQKEKIDHVIELLRLKSIDEFGDLLDKLLAGDEKYTEDEIQLFASLAIKQKSASFNARFVTENDMVDIMRRSLMKVT